MELTGCRCAGMMISGYLALISRITLAFCFSDLEHISICCITWSYLFAKRAGIVLVALL